MDPSTSNNFQALSQQSNGAEPIEEEIHMTHKNKHQYPMQNQGSIPSIDPILTEINSQPNLSSTLPPENLICSTSHDFHALMDEDMGDLDLGELDLLGLEDACKKHAFHTISPKKINLLKEVLNKAKLHTRFGIQNNPPTYLKKGCQRSQKARAQNISPMLCLSGF